MFDVVVIGGGVIGTMTARELTRYRISVCVLERADDVAEGSSKANSGIVHAGYDAESGTLKAKFNVAGSELMESVTQELGVKYRRNGSLVLATNEEERATLNALYDRGVKNGVRRLQLIERAELLSLEPAVAEGVCCALYAPTAAIVCPYELTIAAMGNAMDNGAQLKLNFEVTGICRKDGVFTVKSKNGDTVRARKIINAAGIYADKIARMIGDTFFSIRPRAGQYLLLDKGFLVDRTIFRTPSAMGKGILVLPTVDGNILVGPTSENIEERERKATTSGGLAKIAEEAAHGISGIPFRTVITSFTGLRAVSDTGDFIVRESETCPEFYYAAGIDSPGLSAAPAIARVLCELVQTREKFAESADFNPRREPDWQFQRLSAAEKNEWIQKNPAYGRVVCRCEGITEGEILHAIRANPPANNLDAVKRRTRSGMGRCQGGFCTPFVAEILAKERKIPVEQVTKFGGNSFVNIEKIR